MTALAVLLIFGGVLSVYAGLTGTAVVPALAAVLSGKSPKAAK